MVIRYLFFILILIVLFSFEAQACIQSNEWVRSKTPVLRDKIADENYEVASDPHIVSTKTGELAMIYSGDDSGSIAIKLAWLRKTGNWEPSRILLGKSQGHSFPSKKETPFYRLSNSGRHQIYFIGYENEETYQSQIFLAESDSLEGPYEIISRPLIPRGKLAGKEVYLITSPSVVEHNQRLWMTFLAWDGFENVTQVWSMGAVSDDDGRTWQDIQLIEVPIGMEGQITVTPDQRFLATRTGEHNSSEAIFISCADHPYGPYHKETSPAIEQDGAPWEVNEITAPVIFFEPNTNAPTLYYTGADHARGWWIMSARPLSKQR